MAELIPEEDGRFLLVFARDVLQKLIEDGKTEKPRNYPRSLDNKLGVFCTITKNGALRARGCAGVPSFAGILENTIEAVKATNEDPRFPPVADHELQEIKIELTILNEPKLVEAAPENYAVTIKEGDGLLLKYGMYESLFPPQVWKTIKSKELFLDTLCLSAGLTEGMWKEPQAKLFRFDAQVFSEQTTVMKRLKFRDHLPEMILNGKKDTTWRINDEKNITKGDILSLCRNDGKEFAKAEAAEVKERKFRDLTNEDKEGHEKFSSDQEMYKHYSDLYGIKATPETIVKIIRFRPLL